MVAPLYVPYTLFNLAGEVWAHMFIGVGLEVVLLTFIMFHAWRWRRA